MAPLASLDDVNRVLRYTTGDDAARDAQVRAALTAVEDWIRPLLTALTKEGPQIAVFWDVYEDATLHMPSADCTVTRVRAYGSPITFDSTPLPSELTLGSGYDLDDEGNIMLRPTLVFEPFEGALASRTLRLYSKVEVFYISTGVIPPRVTEGVALLAAGYWHEGPTLLQAITHEKIGDYEYWTSTGQESKPEATPYIQRAMQFLNGSQLKFRVAVT